MNQNRANAIERRITHQASFLFFSFIFYFYFYFLLLKKNVFFSERSVFWFFFSTVFFSFGNNNERIYIFLISTLTVKLFFFVCWDILFIFFLGLSWKHCPHELLSKVQEDHTREQLCYNIFFEVIIFLFFCFCIWSIQNRLIPSKLLVFFFSDVFLFIMVANFFLPRRMSFEVQVHHFF